VSTVNLIPPRCAEARTNRRRRAVWSLACTGVAAVSALTVSVSVANMPAVGEGEARLTRLQARQEELAAQGVALMEELEEKTVEVDLLERVARQPDWSVLLSDMADWSAGGAQLEQVSVRLGTEGAGFQLQVIGLSRSQEYIGDLVRSMRESGRFTKVTLVGTNLVDQSEPPTFRFDIHAVLAGLERQAGALR
jgi:Tfp pilus assembly protein PilN